MSFTGALRRSTRIVAVSIAGILATLLTPFAAVAQTDNYPAKPITIVVGYPAGGSTDQAARILATELSKKVGTSIVIENIGGAAGAIGNQKVASAPPDGYTLLVGSNSDIAINRLVSSAVKYEIKDFTPIGVIASQPLVLVASTKSNIKTMDEFLAVVRQNPGKFSYGTSGTLLQLAGELMKQQAGLSITHAPYKGAAPLVNDLLGGHVDFGVLVMAGSVLPHIRSGKVVALGTMDPRRSPATPDIPALAEHPALKNFSINAWFALMGPAHLPAPVVSKLQKAFNESLQTPELRKALEDSGSVVSPPIADLPSFLVGESAKYKRIVDAANIKE